jgi:hypothetical protein
VNPLWPVLKRRYGATVSSRVWWRQVRELVAICLVYNVERAVKLGLTLLDRLWSRLLYFLQRRISTEAPGCQATLGRMTIPPRPDAR